MVAARFPSFLCAAFAVIVLGPGRPGYAAFDYRLWAVSSTGVSDGAQDQSSSGSKGTDGFETIQGHVQLGHIGRLTTNQLSYALMATSWFQSAPSFWLTHTLSLSSDVQASPGMRLALSGSAMLTQPSMLDTAGSTDPQAAGPRPAGSREFMTLQAGEAFSWELGGPWSLGQSLQGRLYRPISDDPGSTTNKSLTFDAQVTRQWQQDSAGLRGNLGAISSSGNAITDPQTGEVVTASRSSEFGEGTLIWKHDWTPDLTHEATAGVFVLRADRTRVLPAGSAGVLWRSFGQNAELRAGRSADSNIYVGVAFERTYASLRLGLTLNQRQTLRLLAEANLEHDTTVGSTGVEGSANVFLGRVGLRWETGGTFAFGLEYLLRDQRADAVAPGATSPFTSLRRQTAMFTIEASYPSVL
jgi:hypothetical protein